MQEGCAKGYLFSRQSLFGQAEMTIIHKYIYARRDINELSNGVGERHADTRMKLFTSDDK